MLTITDANVTSPGTSSEPNQGRRFQRSCAYCKQDHPIYRCQAFSKLTVIKRREFVSSNKLCLSCMNPSHAVSVCTSKYNCKTCGERHNTLLHLKSENKHSQPGPTSNHVITTNQSDSIEPKTQFAGTSYTNNTVVLGTACVRIQDRCGSYHSVRVLLDSGSQISAITSECVNRIGLGRQKCGTEISGLGQNQVIPVKGQTECSFIPGQSIEPVISCKEVLVLPRITSFMPARPLPSSVRAQYQNLQLADPDFDKPARIDMLLGCDVFPYLIRPCSKIIHSDSLPSALDTYLGWVLVGTVVNSSSKDHLASSNSLSIALNPSLDTLLHRFWSVEEPATPSIPTTEDELCEKWFKRGITLPRRRLCRDRFTTCHYRLRLVVLPWARLLTIDGPQTVI